MSSSGSDDEQFQAIKDWWKANGTFLLSSILVVAVSWAGWNYWTNTKIANSIHASSTFEVLQISMEQGRFGDVAREGLKLIKDQPNSPYSSGAALLLAKFYFEQEEPNRAIEQLTWVTLNAPDDSIKLVAFLRKANLQIQAENFVAAEAGLISAAVLELGATEQANLDYAKAELFLVTGEIEKAIEFLTKVIENTESSTGLSALANLKLDDVIGH